MVLYGQLLYIIILATCKANLQLASWSCQEKMGNKLCIHVLLRFRRCFDMLGHIRLPGRSTVIAIVIFDWTPPSFLPLGCFWEEDVTLCWSPWAASYSGS
jgi:hypothetical protein